MPKLLLVDDESLARRRLRELLEDCQTAYPHEIVAEAASGQEAWQDLQQYAIDIVLLDIHMPDMDGLELARHILRLPHPPAVIFISAYQEHALEAFEVNALDYLLKPVKAARLLVALQKTKPLNASQDQILLKAQAEPRRYLAITDRLRVRLIPLEEIIYCKAEHKYVTVRTTEKEYLSEESLTHLEEEFSGQFLRIHRNCLVAKQHILGFERRKIAVTNPEEPPEKRWVVLLKGIPEVLEVSRRQQHIIREIAQNEDN